MTAARGIEELMEFAARGESADRQNVVPVSFADGEQVFALTGAASRGDEAAASAFFERYFDRVFRYAIVMTKGDEDLAREIVSVTMIKAARTMEAMKSDEDVWRWLSRIARNSFVDHCRKVSRRIRTVGEDALSLMPVEVNPESTLSIALTECLAELPLEERGLVEAYYFEDVSQSALAAQIDSTRKAVESRLARIRRKLRTAILKRLS
jgi:RNA polymerase sigma-70 factor (ECF subfamily)